MVRFPGLLTTYPRHFLHYRGWVCCPCCPPVSDTGVRLPPQQADKIFDAFFTTKTHSTGMGMGLRISRSIVESHGGRLWAADNPPRGARFCFTLPTNGEKRDSFVSADRAEPARTDRWNFQAEPK